MPTSDKTQKMELDKDALTDADLLLLGALGYVVKEQEPEPLQVKLCKQNDELMEVTGVVLAADEVDSQADKVSADEIRKAMRRYLLTNGATIGIRHKGELKKADVVEIYQAPVAFEIGTEKIKPGDWVMTTNLSKLPEVWADVKGGALDAYSIGGYGDRTPID